MPRGKKRVGTGLKDRAALFKRLLSGTQKAATREEWESLTANQLQRICKNRGYQAYSCLKKDDLVVFILMDGSRYVPVPRNGPPMKVRRKPISSATSRGWSGQAWVWPSA